MEAKYIHVYVLLAAAASLATATGQVIPADQSEVNMWFTQNVLPLYARVSYLNPELVTAETSLVVLNVRLDGTGQYNSITDAIKSIPNGNTQRVIINIGPGTYKEKITVEATKRFVTFYGEADNMPIIVFDGTAKDYTTKRSATVFVMADYFVAVNVIFKNSAPWPVAKEGDQAVALTIQGDMASFYGCWFLGIQDTLNDDRGNHFFMDCYIEGTTDFIFGDARSIYLRTELHVVPGNPVAYITAHSSNDPTEESGYLFVHSCVTGTGGIAFLGRPWRPYAKVIFAYSEMTDVVRSQGWYVDSTSASTVYFAEYQNIGPGSNNGSRAPYTRELTEAESQSFMTISYIGGSGWLLPPPVFERPSYVWPSNNVWTYHSGGFLYSTSTLGHAFLSLLMYFVL